MRSLLLFLPAPPPILTPLSSLKTLALKQNRNPNPNLTRLPSPLTPSPFLRHRRMRNIIAMADDGDVDSGGGDEYEMEEEEVEELDNKKDYDVEYDHLLGSFSPVVTASQDEIEMVDSKSFVSTQGWDEETVVARALLPSAIPRIEFWRTFLNGNTKDLIAALSRNRGLINRDTDKSVVAMISLLKEHGLAESDIRLVIVRGRSLFTRSTAAMKVLLKRVQELGLRPGSPIFVDVLSALGSLRPDLFLARMELFRSLGWSEGEFLAALKKSPAFALLTEDNIREKMEFLVEKAGCTQSYIASRPSILTFSLKKRLLPRYYVMNILKSMELDWGEWDFRTLMCIPEKKFVDTFILQHKNEAPRLLEMYDAACDGEFLYN